MRLQTNTMSTYYFQSGHSDPSIRHCKKIIQKTPNITTKYLKKPITMLLLFESLGKANLHIYCWRHMRFRTCCFEYLICGETCCLGRYNFGHLIFGGICYFGRCNFGHLICGGTYNVRQIRTFDVYGSCCFGRCNFGHMRFGGTCYFKITAQAGRRNSNII